MVEANKIAKEIRAGKDIKESFDSSKSITKETRATRNKFRLASEILRDSKEIKQLTNSSLNS